SFNQLYYSFSPTIADWERQNPIFKETVRIVITPLLTSLLVLNHVDIHSEAEMIGYGMGLIFLNLGMYFAGPAIIIHKLKRIKI
ncbi:MAG: PQQ-dependent sugar dehydrogenase, partial [Nitrosopumilaceae archaeon]